MFLPIVSKLVITCRSQTASKDEFFPVAINSVLQKFPKEKK